MLFIQAEYLTAYTWKENIEYHFQMKSGEHQQTVTLLELSQLTGSRKSFQERVSESVDERSLYSCLGEFPSVVDREMKRI